MGLFSEILTLINRTQISENEQVQVQFMYLNYSTALYYVNKDNFVFGINFT